MTDILARIAAVGLSPARYLEIFTTAAESEPAADADPETRERQAYIPLNLHRTRRLLRTWQPPRELSALLARITTQQTWMMITEPWCGDSAQCLPCLELMAREQPAITVQLVLRDQNLDLMDLYLTNGARSIPRLVAFDDQGRELFGWGPRPAAAQAVFDQAKAEGLAKADRLERLHLFYGRDRGAALSGEFVTLLDRYLAGGR